MDLKHGEIKILQTEGGRKEHVAINSETLKALTKLRAIAPRSELACPDNNYGHHRDWWLAALRIAGITDFAGTACFERSRVGSS